MDYDAMLKYVYNILSSNNALKPKKEESAFRNRYLHSKRVYYWAMRLLPDFLDIDKEVVLTAAIFHDVGYAYGKKNHAINSSKIFIEYAKNNNLDEEFIDRVSNVIINHSDKTLLNNPLSSKELIILLEADLLDEEGAMGIAWDLMALGYNKPTDYIEGITALWIHSGHILYQDYMVTPLAKKYWNEKKKLVSEFINAYKNDLFIEGEE